MPNWVTNNVIISGDNATLQELKEQLNKPVITHFPKMEFDKERKEWTKFPNVQEDTNPIFSFWNVIAPTDLDAYYGEEKKEFDSEALNLIQQIELGFAVGNDWYNWNVREWGCKWDASSVTLEEFPDGGLMYQFETPWSPVPQIFQILSEKYPELLFAYEYEEEQGWGGIITWKNGKTTHEEEWDIPSSHADHLERDRECVCAWSEELMYDDCPKEETV